MGRPRQRLLAIAGTIVALVAALAPPAIAQPAAAPSALDEARQAKAALDYDRALELANRALRSGQHGREALADIYLLAGELAGGLDRPAESTRYFRRLLALRPDATLPEGTSPKIRIPFEEARASIERLGALAAHTAVATGPEPAITLVVDRDPIRMIGGARVHYRTSAAAEPTVVEGRGRDRITVTLPPAPRIEAIVSAIDEYGNELLRLGRWDAPIVVQPSAPAASMVPPPPVAGPGPGRAWLYGAGATALLLGGAAYFGLDARDAEAELAELNARSRTEDIDVQRAYELTDRGRRSALFANLGFAAAGLGAAVTVWLGLRRPDQPAAVTPTARADGAGLELRVHF